MKTHTILLSSCALLSGCITSNQELPTFSFPQLWDSEQSKSLTIVNTDELKMWWQKFNDPTLNILIDLAMAESPDRLIAEARILEARGIKKEAHSTLFPQLGITANGGRQDNGTTAVDNYYEAGFDASYEIDVFGKNRKNISAAQSRIEALEEQYQDVTLTLIAEVSRSYINYRAFQKQSAIAKKNLNIQQKTLELIKQQREFGEAPQLDVERSETIVNTTKASIPEFERLADNARLQLTVLTGKLPEELAPVLAEPADIPGSSVKPVLMAPAQVLAIRPDIRAASANLAANTSLAESVTAEIFPTFTLSGFFGVTENVLTSSTTIWNTAIGTAVSILNFGRIEGRIDAARAREMQAYQLYRQTVLQAVTEVETALTDTARINEQRISLEKAYESAERSFTLSETLYREGEISFLDVLDAQRTVNEADTALISAEAAQAESLVRLYKSLGVYE